MKKIGVIIIILILLGLGFFFKDKLLDFYDQLTQKLPAIEKFSLGALDSLKNEILAPPPLRLTQDSVESFLTKAGVISLTNLERENSGLSSLKENAKLNSAALAKAQEMFKNQYFEHVSPAGAGPADLAKTVGYQYIIIGENLAMGNFADDQALVQGWMNSPGHRANILNARYQEIGVAVFKGTYQGKTTWMAVQEFGLPLSACPQPDIVLKTQIENLKNQLTSLSQTIEAKNAEINQTQYASRGQRNQAVGEYNDLVNQYNGLSAQLKNLVSNYNQQVSRFNACAG